MIKFLQIQSAIDFLHRQYVFPYKYMRLELILQHNDIMKKFIYRVF